MVMSAISDDLSVIFDTGVFADEARIAFSSSGAVEIVKGIFDDGDVPTENQLSDVFESYTRQTTFTCPSSQVSALAVNDSLKINGVTYYHAFEVDDGTGVTTLHLSKEPI